MDLIETIVSSTHRLENACTHTQSGSESWPVADTQDSIADGAIPQDGRDSHDASFVSLDIGDIDYSVCNRSRSDSASQCTDNSSNKKGKIIHTLLLRL